MNMIKEATLALIRLEEKTTASKEDQQEVGDFVIGRIQKAVDEFNQVKETSDPQSLCHELATLFVQAIAMAENAKDPAWKTIPIRQAVETAFHHLSRQFTIHYQEA